MPLKVGVVGAGMMGMNHLRVLSDFNDKQVRLVGVAEALEPILQQAMSRFHIAGYSDYRQMVAETHPDLVAVVVPTHAHFEVASYLLNCGINVLIEKPMTSTIEEAAALIQIARTRGVRIAIGHVERFNPAIIELKRRITEGELGEIFHFPGMRYVP